MPLPPALLQKLAKRGLVQKGKSSDDNLNVFIN